MKPYLEEVERAPVIESKPFDFSLFSDAQLHDLAYQVRVEVARRRRERVALARTRGRLTESHGPRYRNPENPAETWSGHGRPPGWVRLALAAGERLDVLDTREPESPAEPEAEPGLDSDTDFDPDADLDPDLDPDSEFDPDF